MQTRLGLKQVSIIVLTVATAAVHLTLAVQAFTQSNDVTTLIMFALNGLGYLGLLAAYFLPLPFAKDNRGLVRWVYMGYAVVTIISWVVMGDKSWPAGAVGYLTKLAEVVLILLLWTDSPNS